MNRLDRLLRIRKAGEGIERGRFDRARLEAAARRAETEAAASKRDAVGEDVRAQSRGAIDVARLRSAADCRDAMARSLLKGEGIARDADRRAEERRRRLEAANRDVRAIEKVAERRAAAETARARAAETRECDDRPRTAERP